MHLHKLKSRITVMITLLSSLSLNTGCSSWFTDDYPTPKVSLKQIEIEKLQLFKQKLKLHFEVTNTSHETLPIRHFNYSVKINQVQLAEGESNQWIDLSPNATASMNIPITTNLWSKLGKIAETLRENDSIGYSIVGEIGTGWPNWLLGQTLYITQEGEINAQSFIEKAKSALKD